MVVKGRVLVDKRRQYSHQIQLPWVIPWDAHIKLAIYESPSHYGHVCF